MKKRGRKSLEEKLSDEQKEYIREHYPNTPTRELAEQIGIPFGSLKTYAYNKGFFKSAQYLKEVRRAASANSSSRFKKGRRESFKSEDAKAAWKKRISEGMKERWQKEYLRDSYGLPQKTKFHLRRLPIWAVQLRYRLRHKGYIIDDKKRIAYWDEHTRRSHLAEERKAWYAFDSVYKRGENVNDVNATDSQPQFVPEPPPVNDFFAFT